MSNIGNKCFLFFGEKSYFGQHKKCFRKTHDGCIIKVLCFKNFGIRHSNNSENKLQIKSLISTKIEGFLNPNYFNWIH